MGLDRKNQQLWRILEFDKEHRLTDWQEETLKTVLETNGTLERDTEDHLFCIHSKMWNPH